MQFHNVEIGKIHKNSLEYCKRFGNLRHKQNTRRFSKPVFFFSTYSLTVREEALDASKTGFKCELEQWLQWSSNGVPGQWALGTQVCRGNFEFVCISFQDYTQYQRALI